MTSQMFRPYLLTYLAGLAVYAGNKFVASLPFVGHFILSLAGLTVFFVMVGNLRRSRLPIWPILPSLYLFLEFVGEVALIALLMSGVLTGRGYSP